MKIRDSIAHAHENAQVATRIGELNKLEDIIPSVLNFNEWLKANREYVDLLLTEPDAPPVHDLLTESSSSLRFRAAVVQARGGTESLSEVRTLPGAIWRSIITQLSLRDRLHLRRVCKNLYKLADPALSLIVNVRNDELDAKEVVQEVISNDAFAVLYHLLPSANLSTLVGPLDPMFTWLRTVFLAELDRHKDLRYLKALNILSHKGDPTSRSRVRGYFDLTIHRLAKSEEDKVEEIRSLFEAITDVIIIDRKLVDLALRVAPIVYGTEGQTIYYYRNVATMYRCALNWLKSKREEPTINQMSDAAHAYYAAGKSFSYSDLEIKRSYYRKTTRLVNRLLRPEQTDEQLIGKIKHLEAAINLDLVKLESSPASRFNSRNWLPRTKRK